MRRLLAALAALYLLVAPAVANAVAARVLVVTPARYPSNDDRAFQNQLRAWTMSLDALGVYHTEVRADQIWGCDMLTGTLRYGGRAPLGTRTTSYDAVITVPWFSAFSTSHDSLTRYSFWDGSSTSLPANASRVIQIMAGPPATNSITSATWGPTAQCSTGVKSFTLVSNGTTGYVGPARSTYLAGTSLVWKTFYDMQAPRMNIASDATPGILRPVFGWKTSAAGGPTVGGAGHRFELCFDCDSMVTYDSNYPDSAFLWARYMYATDTHPVIYAWQGPGMSFGGGTYSTSAIVGAIAMADSLLGGRLIGQKPMWEPLKASIYIGHGFTHSTGATSYATFDGGGVASGDTTFLKQTLDSLAKLGVPVTLGVNVDSIASYPNEKAWFANYTNFKYAIESTTGAWGTAPNGPNAGAASSTRHVDLFGYERDRTMGYWGQTCLTAADTSVACNLITARAIIEAAWPGKFCGAVSPTKADFIPAQYTKFVTGSGYHPSVPDLDSTNTALFWAGIRTVIVDPDIVDTSPNTSWSLNGAQAQITAGSYKAAFNTQRRRTVYADPFTKTTAVGSIFYADRELVNAEATGSNMNLSLQHNYTEDFMQGLFTNLRNLSDTRFYYHTYRSRNSVFKTEIGAFAGIGDGTGKRSGWWQVKHVVNQCKAINALAGRTVVKFVYADDL